MLPLIIINSLLIFGIYSNAGYDDNNRPDVFAWLNKISVPWWLKKPLIECVSCMASIHSLYVYWPWVIWQGQLNLKSMLIYPIYIIALSGLNYLLSRLQ